MDFVYKSAKQRLSPRDVEFIAEYSGLPVYVKGPQCREDVERSLAAGASGIWVTNHGGRQSTVDQLPLTHFKKWQKQLINVCQLSLTLVFVVVNMSLKPWLQEQTW